VSARERTMLAEERTFSARVSTALAAMATGLGVAHLLTSVRPGWLVDTMGVALVLVGAVALAFGLWG